MKKMMALILAICLAFPLPGAAFVPEAVEDAAECVETAKADPALLSADISWRFDQADDCVWTADESGYTLSYADGSLSVDTTSATAASYITHPALNMDTEAHPFLVFKVRNRSSAEKFRFYFRTAEKPEFSEENAFDIAVDKQSYAFKEYKVDMRQFKGWTGTYTDGKLVLHDADKKGMVDFSEIRFSETGYNDAYYHFPLYTDGYTTPFPMFGVAPHSSILYSTYREWANTATGGAGYVEFPSPIQEIQTADYPYMVIKYQNTADSYAGSVAYYFTTSLYSGRGEDKAVYSYVRTGNSGEYRYQIFPMKDNAFYKGILQNGHMTMRGVGKMKITDIFLADDLDFLTNEPEPEPARFILAASDIIDDGGSVTLLPELILAGGAKVTDFSGLAWSVDSTNVHAVKNADESLTLYGRTNGSVNVGVRVTYGDRTYRTQAALTVSGQSRKAYRDTLKLVTYGNALARHEESASLGHTGGGLGASAPEKDYVHRLTALLNERYGSGHVTQVYGKYAENLEALVALADNETDFSESFPAVAAFVAEEKPDIVTVQYGEYLSECDSKIYEAALVSLVNEIRKGAPDAVILLTTPFGFSAQSNAYKGAVAAAEKWSISLCDLASAGKEKDNYAVDAPHTGVAKHPGDKGMQAIASAVFESLNQALTAHDSDAYVPLPEALELPETVTLTQNGEQAVLKASVQPADASAQFVFESTDEAVVSVSADGMLTARGNGTAVVTASARFAPEMKAACTVTVSGQTTFTVSFDKNAVGGVTGMPSVQTGVRGDYLLPQVYPRRQGYLFVGWSETPNGQCVERLPVLSDTTVYAVWKEATALTFETDGNPEGVVSLNGFYPTVRSGKYTVSAVGTDVASGNLLRIRVSKLAIDPNVYDTLVLRMQLSPLASSGKLRLTVLTDNGNTSFERTVPNTALNTYSFDLSEISGLITGLELVPTEADAAVGIEDIRFLNAASSTLRYEPGTADVVSDMPSNEYFSDSPLLPLSSAVPKRDGYRFLGWSRAPDSKLLLSDGELIDTTTTNVLYAVWDKEDHWECDTWWNEIDPQEMDSFSFENGIFSYRASGVGAMQSVKKLGYSTDSTAKKLKVRAKWKVDSAEGLQAQAYLWTVQSAGFNDRLKLTADLSQYGAAPADFVEFELDGTDNPYMNGDRILNIRFNMINKPGACEVDYIRFADSEAHVVVKDGETRKTDSQDVTYIVMKNGTLAPVGTAVFKGLHLSGKIDLSEGIAIVKGTFETDTSGDYQAYTLDMADADVTWVDTMYVGMTKVDMYDGATYLIPKNTAVRFRKLENETGISLAVSGQESLYVGEGPAVYTARFSEKLSNESVLWSVNRPEIASIDKDGVLTPKTDGKVRITAVSAENPAVRATFDVEIRYYPFTLTVSGEKTFSSTEKREAIRRPSTAISRMSASFGKRTLRKLLPSMPKAAF